MWPGLMAQLSIVNNRLQLSWITTKQRMSSNETTPVASPTTTKLEHHVVEEASQSSVPTTKPTKTNDNSNKQVLPVTWPTRTRTTSNLKWKPFDRSFSAAVAASMAPVHAKAQAAVVAAQQEALATAASVASMFDPSASVPAPAPCSLLQPSFWCEGRAVVVHVNAYRFVGPRHEYVEMQPENLECVFLFDRKFLTAIRGHTWRWQNGVVCATMGQGQLVTLNDFIRSLEHAESVHPSYVFFVNGINSDYRLANLGISVALPANSANPIFNLSASALPFASSSSSSSSF